MLAGRPALDRRRQGMPVVTAKVDLQSKEWAWIDMPAGARLRPR